MRAIASVSNVSINSSPTLGLSTLSYVMLARLFDQALRAGRYTPRVGGAGLPGRAAVEVHCNDAKELPSLFWKC